MKFFHTSTIKELDAYTIEHEPIASIDLMERAARVLTDAILERYAGCRFAVFSGPGNNGGDGLAVARMLAVSGCAVQVWLIDPKERLSTDCAVNFLRLQDLGVGVKVVNDEFSMPSLDKNVVIVDALFGSGLNKPVREGIFAHVINGINASGCRVVAEGMLFYAPVSGSTVEEQLMDGSMALSLIVPSLSPVSAVYAGTVVDVYYDAMKGNVVIIQHSNDFLSKYIGVGETMCQVGAKVVAGQRIGMISRNPDSRFVFELWHKGTALQPLDYIAF